MFLQNPALITGTWPVTPEARPFPYRNRSKFPESPRPIAFKKKNRVLTPWRIVPERLYEDE